MCYCNPSIRTPNCGGVNCYPKQDTVKLPFKDLPKDHQLALIKDMLSGTIYKYSCGGLLSFVNYQEASNLATNGCFVYEESSVEEMLAYQKDCCSKELSDIEESLLRR